MTTRLRVICVWGILALVSGCGLKADNRIKWLPDQVKRNSIVQEFREICPGAFYRISYLQNPNFEPEVTLEAGVYGRYLITKVLLLAVDDSTQSITITGVKMRLSEIASFEFDRNGRLRSTTYGQMQPWINEEEWKNIVASRGNFGRVFDTIKQSEPLPNFDHFVSQLTENSDGPIPVIPLPSKTVGNP